MAVIVNQGEKQTKAFGSNTLLSYELQKTISSNEMRLQTANTTRVRFPDHWDTKYANFS